MQFKYWEDKANEDSSEPIEQPDSDIVSIEEVRRAAWEHESEKLPEPENTDENENNTIQEKEADIEDREVEEFFENEKNKKAGHSLAKYIFVDGLLGIPFLTVCYLIISAFVALFFVIAVAFTASFLAAVCLAVFAVGFGFVIMPGRLPTALILIAFGILSAAAASLFLLLAALFGLKIMPRTAGLTGKLENKIHLFRN